MNGQIRRSKSSAHFSSTARASENSNPIAKNTRFHACTRGRPGLFRLSKILCRGQHFLAQQLAHQRIQTQSLKTLDSMQVRVRGLGSHARHARNRLARATPRPTGGDGDGPLADGRTPVECRAHCASSTGRQRRLARVEPVGRGGTNGGEVALRPPFTPRRSTQRARRETARGGAAQDVRRGDWGPRREGELWRGHT